MIRNVGRGKNMLIDQQVVERKNFDKEGRYQRNLNVAPIEYKTR